MHLNGRRLGNLATELETPRLLLRCPEPLDAPIVHASVVESLESLREFPASLPWAMAEPSVEALERYCAEAKEQYLARTAFPFLAFSKETGDHVGNLALHDIEWSVPKCEIGYWVRSRFAGRGMITEAVKGLTDFALDRLEMWRIEALPESDNHRSRRICERAGYALEGILRNYRITPEGVLKHACVYAMVRR